MAESDAQGNDGLREDVTFTAVFWGALLLLAWGYHPVWPWLSGGADGPPAGFESSSPVATATTIGGPVKMALFSLRCGHYRRFAPADNPDAAAWAGIARFGGLNAAVLAALVMLVIASSRNPGLTWFTGGCALAGLAMAAVGQRLWRRALDYAA